MKFLRTYNEAKSGYPIKKIPIKKSIKKKPMYSEYELMVRKCLSSWCCGLLRIKYVINEDRSVDVRCNPGWGVRISAIETDDILIGGKLPFKFGNLIGNFTFSDGSDSIQISTLYGCPESIDGNFNCNKSGISSFIGGPKNITGSLECGNNEHLMSLDGFPMYVGGVVWLGNTPVYDDVIRPIINIDDTDLDNLLYEQEDRVNEYFKYAIRT